MEKPRPGGNQQERLGQLLVESKFITIEQLAKATDIQRRQKGKLGQILIDQRMVTPQDLATMHSILLNVPFIDLTRHVVQPRALKLIPEATARARTIIPLDIANNELVVVMADPEDIRAVEDMQAQSRMRISVALGIPQQIREAIDQNYSALSEIELQASQIAPSKVEPDPETVTSESLASTPVVQTTELVITQAIRDRASDIHMEPQAGRVRVRFRIDGVLKDAFSLPLTIHAPLVSRVKILAGMNIAETRRPQDGQFWFKTANKSVDIRAATANTVLGERVTLRILDKSIAILSLSQLGFLPEAAKKYEEALRSSYGLVLICGPTGSGKTTTLYASVGQLNRNEMNIMTVEDPVEYRFQDITQIQVNPKAGVTFPECLRSILRHDPDVMMVGEVRDGETANMALQSALTGHLVLSSVHANNSVSALFRLRDLGVEPYMMASTVICIVAQRMIRRICPHCRATYQPPPEELAAFSREMGKEAPAFYRGEGCSWCANTGYLGRTGVYEVLLMSEELRRLTLAGASASDTLKQALREGLVTMKHDGMVKVQDGITTIYEVLRNVYSIE